MRKVYTVGGANEYSNWMEAVDVKTMEESQLVLFVGGEDISPELYKKAKHPTTYNNPRRDEYEVKEFKKAVALGRPIISICRGSQLSCVMAGGLLVQHQQHPNTHLVKTSDGRKVRVSNSHHQRMWPYNLPKEEYELLAWAIDDDGSEQLSPYSYGSSYDETMDGLEAEIVFFPKIRSLSCQSHPEWAYPAKQDWEKEYIAYCRELIVKYLKV